MGKIFTTYHDTASTDRQKKHHDTASTELYHDMFCLSVEAVS
jgi:hypothetical protein